MSLPSPAVGGVASLIGGFLEGYLGSKTRQAEDSYAREERNKEYQKRLQEREDAENRMRQKEAAEVEQNVQQGTELFRGLLDPSVKPEEAMLQLSAFDQTKGTRFTPLYGEFAKARASVPFVPGPDGQEIKNPYYVPKYVPRADVRPDVKNNKLWKEKGKYDPVSGEWETDKEGERILSDISYLGKMIETDKKGGNKGVSAALQENLNKMASGYITAISAAKAIEDGKDVLFADDFTGEKYQAARLATGKAAWTARNNLDTWVSQVLPAANKAEEFLSDLTKAAKGRKIPPEYWKKVIDNYKMGELDDLDVQLLAYKYLTMYGTFPKGYIPAFRTSGEVVETEEEDMQEE